MLRPKRAALALSLLAATAAAVPAGAHGGYAGGGYVDADVYVASVRVPGGRALVEAVVLTYRGAEAEAAGGMPGANPDVGQHAWACVTVQRGRSEDQGCADIAPAAVSAAADLSEARLVFTLPSGRARGGGITVDLTLTAAGGPEPSPGYEVYSTYGPISDTWVAVGAGIVRNATAAGSVTSKHVGGGKVESTAYGLLRQEHFVASAVFAY